VDEVIEAVGLSDKSTELIRTLSGGQRRRLDVALGIIGSPELLFLDEPTTGFDPKARRAFWALIEDLRKSGTTILLTTHYLDEAEALADRVAVINKGKIIEVSTPALLGGRATSLATVSWNGADGLQSERTDNPTALIRKLTEIYKDEIPELTVKRASLEDIYLEMIGGADGQ
jgi:ABC-2 type transport system ATP-binding protein